MEILVGKADLEALGCLCLPTEMRLAGLQMGEMAAHHPGFYIEEESRVT